MDYIDRLSKKMLKSKNPIRYMDEIEKHQKNIWNKIQTARNIIKTEQTPKAKYANGYATMMSKLNGGDFQEYRKSKDVMKKVEYKNHTKNFVAAHFSNIKRKPKDPYNQGAMRAIMDYKDHNRKDNLNIFNEKIKKKRK